MGEARGNAFMTFPKEGRKRRIAVRLETSQEVRELRRELYQKAKQDRKRLSSKVLVRYSGAE